MAQGQRVVPFEGTLAALLGEQPAGQFESLRLDPEFVCMLVEQLPGLFVVMRIARQRQVVRGVAAGAIEAEALDRLGDAVGNRQRVAEDAAVLLLHAPLQALFHLPERTDEGGRVAPIEADRIEAAAAQMQLEALQPLMGAQFGALLDAPAIGDHHRQRRPPARNPVAAALFLGGTIGEERHQGLAGQRHVRILQFGEAEVAALGDTAGGMRIHVAAQWRRRCAVGGLGVAVEVLQQAVQPFLAVGIGALLLRVQVAGEDVQRVDGDHAMALAHQPGASLAGQDVECQIAGVGRDHVQGSAGVALGLCLEILGLQGLAVQADAPGVGHVHDDAQGAGGQPVEGAEQLVDAGQVRLQPGLDQLMSGAEHGGAGLCAMLERTMALQPRGKRRLGRRMGKQLVLTGQNLTHGG